MLLNNTTQLIIKIILWTALWSLLIFLSAPLMAEEVAASMSSTSITYSKSTEPDKKIKDKQLKVADADVMTPLNQQGYRTESTVKALHITGSGNSISSVTLYDASTTLISDLNYDGFYHRFSVAIDADTIFDSAYIYARLYLSYEGGPWNLYTVSDNYHIYGDSEFDTFVIETELGNGFPPGYYDVRIELYDADYGDWLLSYGPYDDASLSTLPLQDSYYDDLLYPIETEVVVVDGHAGAMNWLLLVPVLIVVARVYYGARR